MRVQNLDLGLKVHILQEGPHRSMKDHIGTMVMFYIRSQICIMQKNVFKLLKVIQRKLDKYLIINEKFDLIHIETY